MNILTVQHYGFDLYFKLLTKFNKNIKALLIFNLDGLVLWNSRAKEPNSVNELTQIIRSRNSGKSSVFKSGSHRTRIANHTYELIHPGGAGNISNLIICVEMDGPDESLQSILETETVTLLNQGLLEWYRVSLKFASQEDELNAMTDELTRRYEELNLIYRADDQAQNFYNGRELLSELVENAPGIINVDLAVMALPGKNLTIYKYKNDEPVSDSDVLLRCVRNDVFNRLVVAGASLVVNHEQDADRSNLKFCPPYKLTASPLVNAEGEVIGVFALLKKNSFPDFDNSDRNLLDVLANKASKIVQFNFDPLTGLENSSSFELVLSEALKQAVKSKKCHALANIDIDGMAVINSIAGREGGDRLIKQVGQKIAAMIRSEDWVARLGGDKFGVCLQNCDLIRAKVVMNKISDEISNIKFEWGDKLYEVSISVGIVLINSTSKSITSLMNAAESARAKGKLIGPNRISIFEADDRDLIDMKDQVQWLGRIQAALKEDSYLLYAQSIEPINSLTETPHFEVLIRMVDSDNNIIPPGMFLPAAEKFQLMPKIDCWVISRTLEILSEFFNGLDQLDYLISINLSGQSLSDPDALGDHIEAQIKIYEIAPSRLCFEITESSAIANLASANRFINRMRALGCQFSLDDFGTGLSSFAYLKNLNVNYLKIDGSFVHNILSDVVSESMVSAINQVGHAMGLSTVAEYVENDGIKNKLVELGVDFAQGYGVGLPIDLREQLTIVRNAHKEASRKKQS